MLKLNLAAIHLVQREALHQVDIEWLIMLTSKLLEWVISCKWVLAILPAQQVIRGAVQRDTKFSDMLYM